MLIIMIAAVMCGRSSATDIALFAELRRAALHPLVRYDRAPSHDTISRLLRVLDAAAFARGSEPVRRRFRTAADCAPQGAHVAIDGKALRRACDAAQAATPPIMLSAFASKIGLTNGVAAGPGAQGFDEGKCAVEPVKLLELAGKIVTADALHCNRAMARALAGQGAHYILRLERNRAAWHDDAAAAFAEIPRNAQPARRHPTAAGNAAKPPSSRPPGPRPQAMPPMVASSLSATANASPPATSCSRRPSSPRPSWP